MIIYDEDERRLRIRCFQLRISVGGVLAWTERCRCRLCCSADLDGVPERGAGKMRHIEPIKVTGSSRCFHSSI